MNRVAQLRGALALQRLSDQFPSSSFSSMSRLKPRGLSARAAFVKRKKSCARCATIGTNVFETISTFFGHEGISSIFHRRCPRALLCHDLTMAPKRFVAGFFALSGIWKRQEYAEQAKGFVDVKTKWYALFWRSIFCIDMITKCWSRACAKRRSCENERHEFQSPPNIAGLPNVDEHVEEAAMQKS